MEGDFDRTALYVKAGRGGDGFAYLWAFHMPREEAYDFVPGALEVYKEYLDPEMFDIIHRIAPVLQDRTDSGVLVKVDDPPLIVLRDPSTEDVVSRAAASHLPAEYPRRPAGSARHNVLIRWWNEDNTYGEKWWEPADFGLSDANSVPFPELMKCLEHHQHVWEPQNIGGIRLYCNRCDWFEDDWAARHLS